MSVWPRTPSGEIKRVELPVDSARPAPAGELEISRDCAGALGEALEDCRARLELSFCALLEESGMVLSWSAAPGEWQVDELGALAAGVYGSMRALSLRAGETSFQGCFQCGSKRSLHLRPVRPTFLLLAIFDTEIAPGLVRLHADRTAARLERVLEHLPRHDEMPGNSFRSFDFARMEAGKPISG